MSLKPHLLLLLTLLGLAFSQLSSPTVESISQKVQDQLELLKKKDFKESEDLSALLRVSQIDESILSSHSDKACAVLQPVLKNLNMDIPQTLYNLAEIRRIHQCKFLDRINDQIEAMFKDHKSFTELTDLYYLFQLHSGASVYKFKSSDAFKTTLSQQAKDNWVSNFADDWSYSPETKGQGLTTESIRVAEILISLIKNKDFGDKVGKNLAGALKKLTGQAYEDEKMWFIVTKNAHQLDNVDMNLRLLDLITVAQSKLSFEMKTENLIKFRNYFLQKALSAPSLSDLNSALKGLKALDNYAFVTQPQGVSFIKLGEKNGKTVFEFVDMLSRPHPEEIKTLKVSQVSLSNSDQKAADISKQFKVSTYKATYDPDMKDLQADSYQLQFQVITKKGLTYTLTYNINVLDSIKVKSLSYKYATSKSFAVDQNQLYDYPNKLTQIKDLQEGYYCHIAVQASFAKSSSQPQQVYLSLKKNSGQNLYVNKYAKYNKDKKEYQITLDIANDMEHLNGEYLIEVHFADQKAEKEIWELGKINLYFKQGLDEGDNQGVNEQYVPKDIINHIFPPESQDKNLLVPSIGVGAIGLVFLMFFKNTMSLNANLSNLSFIGILFLANVLLIMAIFLMFWHSVKLIPTLWILSAISPISLFIINKGLVSADCSIPEMKTTSKRKE